MSERRYDIDWLRVMAVLLLVPYHTAVIFNRAYVSYIKAQPSAGMEAFAYFMNQWHMALFFLVSGTATWFSLGSRTGIAYIEERFKRLIVPLVFGTLAVVPVQVYFQRLYYGEFSGTYMQFYPHVFEGIYPHGNFTWGQLWFLAYLFVFSLLALPLFIYIKTESGKRVILRAGAFCERSGMIFLAAVPLAIAQATLRAKWPGFQNLYNDWANFVFYFTVFIYGYLLCSDMRFGRAIEASRTSSLVMGIISMAVILTLRRAGAAPAADYSLKWILYMSFHGFSSWCWIAAILGFGRKHLNFSNRTLERSTEAALPFYILHHAVIVATSYYVVRWNSGVMTKFSVITTVSLAGAMALYDLFVRRTPVTRFFFGMKRKRGKQL